MSYREMRTFTEMMRTLGYNRIISMENFRTPNFPLVAEILSWLVQRYDSHADVPQSLDTEQDRIIFIKTVAHFMATRACVRLNTKKLYQANGFAVKELMKITKVLYSAMCENEEKGSTDSVELCVTEMFDVAKKRQLQEGRSLSSQLASSGASLHALLGREADLREARDNAIRRQLDSTWVEKYVADARDELREQVQKTQSALVNVASDEANLDNKIEKRRSELERNRKRLSTLQSVRPAYIEEYEQLEEELSSLYAFYLTRFRNLAFLENQYEELMRVGSNQSEECEMTLKTIENQLKQNTEHPDGDTGTSPMERKKLPPGALINDARSRTLRRNGEIAQLGEGKRGEDGEEPDDDEDDEDDDVDDDDGGVDDLVGGHEDGDEAGMDDDDEDDEDDDDEGDEDDTEPNEIINPDLFNRKKGGVNVGRNQLAPGWSPSRQRIPGASYHGRQPSSYRGDLILSDGLETDDEKIRKPKAIYKQEDLIESGNEDLMSNEGEEDPNGENDDEDEDEGDEDLPPAIHDEFINPQGRKSKLMDELGVGLKSSRNMRAKAVVNDVSLGLRANEEEEDDDF